MAKWRIVEQEESVGKNKIPVRCKRMRYFPIEGKNGEVSFGKLGFLLLQIIVENEKGEQLRLKLNASQGINHPAFVIQHPDTMEHPLMWVGEKKKRRQIVDVLAPKVRVPGERERYDAVAFEKRLTNVVGVLVANDVMDLFARKLAHVANKDDAKRKAA